MVDIDAARAPLAPTAMATAAAPALATTAA